VNLSLPAFILTLLTLAAPAQRACAQASSVVEGRLTLALGPARKWASRYPGSGVEASEVHPVPAVVFLEGDLPRAPAADSVVSILQEGGRFVPGALAVRSGTVVRFPNGDPFYHNVFSYAGPRFDLGRYPFGESREVLFDRPGIVRTYCEIHEFMRAVILVTDHGFHAVVDEDGSFRIAGVPAGRYTLKAYHPDFGTTETPVVVPVGGTVSVALEMGG
jgi:plastocyanin